MKFKKLVCPECKETIYHKETDIFGDPDWYPDFNLHLALMCGKCGAIFDFDLDLRNADVSDIHLTNK